MLHILKICFGSDIKFLDMDFRVSLNCFLLNNKTSESMLMDLIANPAPFSFKINTFLFSNFFENIMLFNILPLQTALHFAK